MVAGDKDPTEAKNRMKTAAIGLGIALISWLILFTINPDLVKKLDLTNLRKIESQQTRIGENINIIESRSDIESCTRDGGTPTTYEQQDYCITR